MASGGGLQGTFSYSDTDITRIGNIFEGSEEFFATPSLTGCRRKYDTQSKKCVELKLHGLTLTEYLRLQRIPRGLRVNLQPTLFAHNEEFKTKFAGIINKCSLDIIALNIEFIQQEIKNLETQLNTTENILKSVLQDEEFIQIKNKTDATLEKLKGEVSRVKKQKFDRDATDYERGTVYNWSYQPYTRECYRRDSHRSRERTHSNTMDKDESTPPVPFLDGGDREREQGEVAQTGGEIHDGTRERRQQPRRMRRNK
ncbi:hypothetical protein XELAEV_18029145mg [Xenopus laevis]|uniref:Uncharacterized protein n=1 Tax=Xenopus laevis TaxID=8355 RepID=A0A974HHH3_XENLA|nr:hypothetical protein XELAEV_18029145mg [Xenopus laevis]